MRRALILLLLSASAAAQDPAASTRALVEIATPKDAYYVGETIPVTMRIAFDPAYFATNVIQATRQQLDVPVQVDASFLRDLLGAVPHEEGESREVADKKTFALNEGLGHGRQVADRIVSGRPFTVLELTRRFQPDRAGTLVIPGPELRFSYASRFEEDLVNGRVPVDRREALIHAEDRTLTVHALPDEGRPPGFTGAVGHFSVRAAAEPRVLDAGASLSLTLTIEGDGNLRSFAPPRLDALPGFRSLGVIEHPGKTARVLVYDLVPVREDTKQIPAISFVCFEPDPRPRYRTLKTDPIPITVKRPAAGAGAPPPPVADEPASRTASPARDLLDLKPVGLPRAESAYRAGRFDEARAGFEAELGERGRDDAALLYDAGNCFFRLGRRAEAIVAYRRALLRAPRDPMVRSNLELAAADLGAEGWRPRLIDSLTTPELAALAVVAAVLGILGLARARRRTLRAAAAILLVIGIAAALFAAKAWWLTRPDGVVIADDVALRADPHAAVDVTMRLRAGERVRIDEMTDRWVRVAHARGSGWTERKGIGVVE